MTTPDRPDPDTLLAAVQRDEARAHRGRLKIFIGASAGVGKTYSMLEAARGAQATGADIVVGYVEPHGRRETETLLEGLEQLPPVEVRYRGITRREFDLDAALKRRPATLIVDELAHSNIAEGEPRPRHAKRWQDIEELLEAGVNVWTTLNIQHLESLNDVVAGITGVRQQETLPDRVFDEAEEVELIDLSPDDLLERLKAGKIYVSDKAATAADRFFRRPNLMALRELALRRTADRVDAAARAYVGDARSSKPWLARDRFLIAIAPDDQAGQLVRIGKRFADALDAEWLVVSVETPALLKLGEHARNRRIEASPNPWVRRPSRWTAHPLPQPLPNTPGFAISRASWWASRGVAAGGRCWRPRRPPSWYAMARGWMCRSSRAGNPPFRRRHRNAPTRGRSTGAGTGRPPSSRCFAPGSRR